MSIELQTMNIELETTESIILGDKANNKLKDSETNLTNSTDEYNNKNKIVNLDDLFTHLTYYFEEYNNKIKNYHNEASDKIKIRIEKYRNETQQLIGNDMNKQNYKEKTFYHFFSEKLNFIFYYKFYGEKTSNNIEFFCNGCGKKSNGSVYKCITCKLFLLCKECIFNNGPLHSSEHIFKPMLEVQAVRSPYMNTDANLDSLFKNISNSSFEIIHQDAKDPISINVTVKNNGNKSWDSKTNIDFVNKNGIPVSIGNLQTGQEITKTVTLFSSEELAKLEIGKYEKTLQLTNSNGYFGKTLPIKLVVKPKKSE